MVALAGTLKLTRSVVSIAGSNLADTTTQIVVAGSSGGVGGGGSRSDETILGGEFRTYANGVTRLILGSAKTRTQTLALRALSPSQVAAVLGMQGLVVCFRDTYGRKVFGAFLATSVTNVPLSDLTDIGFTIQSVTWDEAV